MSLTVSIKIDDKRNKFTHFQSSMLFISHDITNLKDRETQSMASTIFLSRIV